MESKTINPETMKKIIAELEKGRKPLLELVQKMDAADATAEKLEKAIQ